MSKIDDLTGQRFGRLTVIKDSGRRSKNRQTYWTCQCDCGTVKEILRCSLKNGDTQSCGCLNHEHICEHRPITYDKIFYQRNVDLGIDPECHECTSHAKTKKGYIHYQIGNKQWRLHRYIHYLNTRELPEVILHLCDNPACINPLHLKSGTVKENNQDKASKGRSCNQHKTTHACPCAITTGHKGLQERIWNSMVEENKLIIEEYEKEFNNGHWDDSGD